jgi:hypothetical protein
MPVKRELWKEPLKKNHPFGWHCPTCKGGYLDLKPDSLHYSLTSDSVKDSAHEAWEPDWDRYRFTMLLVCNNRHCRESVVVSGDRTIEVFQTSWDSWDNIESLYPSYVSPSPMLIPIAEDFPEPVSAELRLSFVASWSDFSSAGNHIRSAVERLLDHLDVPKSIPAKNGGSDRRSLNQRIKDLEAHDEKLFSYLNAVKWIGNQASHTDELTRDDIFDALDIIDSSLEYLFSKDGERVQELVKAINRAKGTAKK